MRSKGLYASDTLTFQWFSIKSEIKVTEFESTSSNGKRHRSNRFAYETIYLAVKAILRTHDTPVMYLSLLTEVPFKHNANREKMTQVMLATFNCPMNLCKKKGRASTLRPLVV
ncbi:Actin-2, partial [Taenia solium]